MAGDGWMPGCERVEMVPERYATNVGIAAGDMVPQAIVDHVMGGHYGYALTMMRDTTVGDDDDDYASWHFSIAQDGRVAQHASIWTPCMGAGLKAHAVTGEPISTFRKRWHYNPNAWTVHIEHEDKAARNPFLTEPQIEASIRVHRWVWNQCEWLRALPRGFWWLPDTADSRITGHYQYQADRADDPGANFPWGRIMEATLAPEPAPVVDDFQRGRSEVHGAWVREDWRRHEELVAASLAYHEWVKARKPEWGIA